MTIGRFVRYDCLTINQKGNISMKQLLIVTLTCTAVILSLALVAEASLYHADMRECMKEGSRADCESVLK